MPWEQAAEPRNFLLAHFLPLLLAGDELNRLRPPGRPRQPAPIMRYIRVIRKSVLDVWASAQEDKCMLTPLRGKFLQAFGFYRWPCQLQD